MPEGDAMRMIKAILINHAFAGIWTTFYGDRGTKSKPIPRPHQGDRRRGRGL
jgi:hypothetical protein